jgi:hypothetical protein
VKGVRNHLLKFSEPETWLAQEQAGFTYDATYGHVDTVGPKDGHMLPFFPPNTSSPRSPTTDNRLADSPGLVELPLTVMDYTLFRRLKLSGKDALEAAWNAVTPIIEQGGLVSLLWHNNYFNEPEYHDWQWVYEQLLDRLAGEDPWCATGNEIAEWWREREG